MSKFTTLIVELNDAVNRKNKDEDIAAIDKVLTSNNARYCGWDGWEKQPKYKSGADALIEDFSDFEYLEPEDFDTLN